MMTRNNAHLGNDLALGSDLRPHPSALSKGQVPVLHLTGLYKAFRTPY
jgi:hypothetical protein